QARLKVIVTRRLFHYKIQCHQPSPRLIFSAQDAVSVRLLFSRHNSRQKNCTIPRGPVLL
ncbi:hypothetical protein, partial [Klebsiella pneumoniae]|uniref:hypothetical protein n=1 Tax=Klebsiella pneumoniae TaxID=573 RepID=UPI001BD331C4